jgi:hypothetical protein
MAKLPHIKNDIVASKYYEPIYTNLFEVRIQFPAAVDDSQRELVLDNIIKVSGLDTEKLPDTTTQKFKGISRTFAGSVLSDSSHTVTIEVNLNLDDSNSMFVYKLFKRWSDLIYKTSTGEKGLAAEYKAGTLLTVTVFNKREQIFRTYKAPDIFINAPITSIEEYSYENNDAFDPITISFQCDRIDVIDN